MPFDGYSQDEDTRAKRYIRHLGRLEGDRGIWNSHWDQVEPASWAGNPVSVDVVAGSKWTQDIFDATTGHALQRFAAAVESVICPRGQTAWTRAPGSGARAQR